MKIDPRNKWKKAVLLNLDTSSTDATIKDSWRNSTQARSIKIYDYKISRFEIQPMMNCLIKVSFLTTLVIYKAYFKSHQVTEIET